MIDREQVIRMATDSGIWVCSSGYTIVGTTEKLQALITRVQNEAYERAASICDEEARKRVEDSMWGIWSSVVQCGQDIRGLKQTEEETNAKR